MTIPIPFEYVRKLEADVEALRLLLREIEFIDAEGIPMCPSCFGSEQSGHDKECRLKVLIS
jgi:hypothetical protein